MCVTVPGLLNHFFFSFLIFPEGSRPFSFPVSLNMSMISTHLSNLEVISAVETQILLTVSNFYFLLLFPCLWCACVCTYVQTSQVHVEAPADVRDILHRSFTEAGSFSEIHISPVWVVLLAGLLGKSCLCLWRLETGVSHHYSSWHFTGFWDLHSHAQSSLCSRCSIHWAIFSASPSQISKVLLYVCFIHDCTNIYLMLSKFQEMFAETLALQTNVSF